MQENRSGADPERTVLRPAGEVSCGGADAEFSTDSATGGECTSECLLVGGSGPAYEKYGNRVDSCSGGGH